MTYHLGVLFLCALDKNPVTIVGYLHGIETDNLTDCLLDRQVGEMAGNSEVLQFVVDEVNGLFTGDCIQVFEHFRE